MRGTVGNVGEAAFLRKAPPQTSPGKHFDPRIIKPKRYVVSRMQRGQCGSKAQTLAALMYGGQWSPSEPAEASGCRLSLLAAMPPNNLRRSAQIRRLRELQSMVPEVVCCPAEASGCRHCRPGGSKWNRALPGRRQQPGVNPVRGGNADKSFSENSGKPEKSAASIYGG